MTVLVKIVVLVTVLVTGPGVTVFTGVVLDFLYAVRETVSSYVVVGTFCSDDLPYLVVQRSWEKTEAVIRVLWHAKKVATAATVKYIIAKRCHSRA